MRILGLDLSTKRVGFADVDGNTFSITTAYGADENPRRLSTMASQIERRIRTHPPLPDLVVIEGYSLNSPGRIALIRLGEIGGVVRCHLHELDIPFMEVPPASLKRHATGNGNADKDRMYDRAKELGSPARNHDEADAWLLRRMARQAHGFEQPTLAHELDAIAALTW